MRPSAARSKADADQDAQAVVELLVPAHLAHVGANGTEQDRHVVVAAEDHPLPDSGNS
jgi:hypothetical protein